MSNFLQLLTERVLVLDGAMGAMLQARSLAGGAPPEGMNLEQPEVVAAIHREYVAAGADIIETNTFGANRPKLANYGLENRVREINHAAVKIARGAAGPQTFVAGSVGPTGRFLEPVGDAGFDEIVEIYVEQIAALVEAGVHLITFETFLDIRELRAAIVAAKTVTELPLAAMLTFDDTGQTALGTPPEAAAVTLDALGVAVVGANCGLGIDGIHRILEQMRAVTSLPLIAQANAGLPELRDGETVFSGTPKEMTGYHERLIKLGVRVIGGCCGTTPQHIQAMQAALQHYDQGWQAPPRQTFLSSRTKVMPIGGEAGCLVIGERINPTGKKNYTTELHAGKTAYVCREAQEQVAAGADLLDINCGAPGINEPLAMERVVFAASGVVAAPLVLDSSNPEVLERGLKAADGKVLLNSVSGDDKSLRAILPLAKKYGAAIIGLALDEWGIPETAEGRVTVAEKILSAAEACGLPREDIIIDCLTLPVSVAQQGAMETLQTLRLVRDRLKLATVLGVSNISFGLPGRSILSATFFSMALETGLQAAIINPKDEAMMDALRAAKVLLGQDRGADGDLFPAKQSTDFYPVD